MTAARYMPPQRGGLPQSRIVRQPVRVLTGRGAPGRPLFSYRSGRIAAGVSQRGGADAVMCGRKSCSKFAVWVRRSGSRFAGSTSRRWTTMPSPNLSGLARLQRHVRARPGADDPGFHPLQRALRAGHAAPVEIDAAPRIPEDHDARRQQIRCRRKIARRDLSSRRRRLAHRRGLQPGAVQGDPALCAGGAEPRRQHAVRQRLCRL